MKTTAVLAGLAVCADAFSVAPRASPASAKTLTKVSAESFREVSYGEGSRKFRRTQYVYAEQWQDHRSTNRIFKNMATFLESGVFRGLREEVGAVVLSALVIFLWNAAANGDFETFIDPAMTAPLPKLQIPSLGFTLATPALGLLLVFRTDASYGRWFEARAAWGLIINTSRILNRQCIAWQQLTCPDEAEAEKRHQNILRVAALTSAFARTVQLHFQREKAQDPEWFAEQLLANTKLPLREEDAKYIAGCANRGVGATTILGSAVAIASNDMKDSTLKLAEMDKNVGRFDDQLGCSERLFGSPVPLIYTRHTSRFLSFYLLLMPLALVAGTSDPNASHLKHFIDTSVIIPEAAAIAIFLFGIDELAIQLEEPFTILPLEKLATGIDNAVFQITQTYKKPQITGSIVVEDRADAKAL